jgi:alkylated DNA repair dioxygenase AlkB
MYDRVVAIPRLLASFPLASAPAGLPFADLLAFVRRHVDAPFNAVGMNLYRDGADSVAMHGDKLHTIVAPHPIALLSLGATRRMLVKAKAPGARAVGIDLAPGSLLVMSHAAQSTHEHGIPKTKAAVGPRLSVVFRVRSSVDRPYDG